MANASFGLPREGYDQIKAWNASLLKVVIKQTPAHAWQQFFSGAERGDTPAFRIGTMLHEAILEPKVFANYVTCEHGSRTKAYKEAMADAKAKGQQIAATSEHELALSMATAIRNHPILGSRFGPDTEDLNEVTLQWETDGKPCKARLDCLRWLPQRKCLWIGDLKTTNDGGWDSFGRAALDYLYILQAAFYADGTYACRRSIEQHLQLEPGELDGCSIEFEFICVEKAEPFLVSRYLMTDDLATTGRSLYEAALERSQTAKELDYWPGYDSTAQSLELPPWADRVVEKMLTGGTANA